MKKIILTLVLGALAFPAVAEDVTAAADEAFNCAIVMATAGMCFDQLAQKTPAEKAKFNAKRDSFNKNATLAYTGASFALSASGQGNAAITQKWKEANAKMSKELDGNCGTLINKDLPKAIGGSCKRIAGLPSMSGK